MTDIKPELLEVKEYSGTGYLPLIDYGEWRVAVLNYHEALLPENIKDMQRHDETDEVFVLLAGRCILFIGEGDAKVTGIYAQDLEPYKFYNVKKACWHNHTLSRDARVLIVENRDTTGTNSPMVDISPEQRQQVVGFTKELWKNVR